MCDFFFSNLFLHVSQINICDCGYFDIFRNVVMNGSHFSQLPSQMKLQRFFIVHVKSPDCIHWSTSGLRARVEPGLSKWREQNIDKSWLCNYQPLVSHLYKTGGWEVQPRWVFHTSRVERGFHSNLWSWADILQRRQWKDVAQATPHNSSVSKQAMAAELADLRRRGTCGEWQMLLCEVVSGEDSRQYWI